MDTASLILYDEYPLGTVQSLSAILSAEVTAPFPLCQTAMLSLCPLIFSLRRVSLLVFCFSPGSGKIDAFLVVFFAFLFGAEFMFGLGTLSAALHL